MNVTHAPSCVKNGHFRVLHPVGDEEAALQPEVDSLARGKSVCPKPKQFVLGGRGALGLIPDASWEGGKATVQRKM